MEFFLLGKEKDAYGKDMFSFILFCTFITQSFTISTFLLRIFPSCLLEYDMVFKVKQSLGDFKIYIILNTKFKEKGNLNKALLKLVQRVLLLFL